MTSNLASGRIDNWRILLAALLLFFPFLGGVHLFDWDEINFAELAREMVVSGNYLSLQLDFVPFTEKPPLFIWLQALSMNIFGVGEYAARFPNAIAGLLSLWFLYNIGFRLHGQRFARWWVLAYVGSTLPHLYFKSGIIDPWFNLFIFAGLWMLIQYHWKRNEVKGLKLSYKAWSYLGLAALATGLAILTKGPVAFLIISLSLFVYWTINRFRFFIKPLPFLGYTALALACTALWFGVETLFNGPDFIVEFTIRQWALLTTPDAGHGGFAGYHFVVLLLGCFPASIFAVQSLLKREKGKEAQHDMHLWMLILFWVVLILFSLVRSKIVHYSSIAYFPLTYLAANSLSKISQGEWKLAMWMKGLLALIGSLYALAGFALYTLGTQTHKVLPYIQDVFAKANFGAQVDWPWYTLIPSIWMFGLISTFLVIIAKRKVRSLNILLIGHVIWIQTALYFYVGRVEAYSQKANIEFFKSKSKENAYLATYKYKSYAPYFYGQTQPENRFGNSRYLNDEALDRELFISVRIDKKDEFELNFPKAKKLYEENGFLFYQFKPSTP